jgi:hypothetical protein
MLEPMRSTEIFASADLSSTVFTDLMWLGRIGSGCRCVVFEGRRRNERIVIKVYRQAAIEKHLRRIGGSIAQYEYARNVACYSIPHLKHFVAKPVGVIALPGAEVFLQEHVHGEDLESYCEAATPAARRAVLATIEMIVARAHDAGLFDLDLQPNNIIVTQGLQGEPHPVLFDFNKVPYHLQPPNALAAASVRFGLSGPQSRDLRYLRRLKRNLGNDRIAR